MNLVARHEWGASYAQGSGPIAGPVRGVTLHWEGPHMGDFPHGQCARKVKSIERFHAAVRGWSGIAYSLVVCPHGSVYEGRGVGIRSAANGTSNIGGNDQWYAVCYLGGQGDGFTDAGKQGMRDAVAYLRSKGAGPQVNGHRDHHPTECPGDTIYRWLNRTDFDQEDDMPTPADLWNFKVPMHNGKEWGAEQPAKWALAQSRHATHRCLDAIADLARLIGDSKLTDREKADLADQIAKRVRDEVEQMNAEAIADELTVTTKE